jgi:RNA polymerase sigma-70 factor (ECF subfamily)
MGDYRGRPWARAADDSSANGPVVADSSRTPSSAGSQLVVARRILERGRGPGEGLVAEGGRGTAVLPELAAIEAVTAGTARAAPEPEEFLALFQEYERYVASIGSRILGANNGVDDLVQEVFLVIYQEFHKLRDLTSVKAWLATIATRVAWRQRGRPWLYSKLSLAQVEELTPVESTDASPELQADLATLLDRLRSMPATLREPWLLRFIDGETLPRIAELCECSQSTVQRRLREAGEVMLGEKAGA